MFIQLQFYSTVFVQFLSEQRMQIPWEQKWKTDCSSKGAYGLFGKIKHIFCLIIMYIIQSIVTIICLTDKITWKKEVILRNAYFLNIYLGIRENLGNLLNYALQFFITKLAYFRVVMIKIIQVKHVSRVPGTQQALSK